MTYSEVSDFWPPKSHFISHPWVVVVPNLSKFPQSVPKITLLQEWDSQLWPSWAQRNKNGAKCYRYRLWVCHPVFPVIWFSSLQSLSWLQTFSRCCDLLRTCCHPQITSTQPAVQHRIFQSAFPSHYLVTSFWQRGDDINTSRKNPIYLLICTTDYTWK